LIRSIKQALDLLLFHLKEKGYTVVSTRATNFGRHYIIEAKHWNKPKKYRFYLAFQREWFIKMPQAFKNANAVGATLNREILNKLYKEGYDLIIFAHSTGFYAITPEEMYSLVLENNWIRKSQKTGEETAHIPISYLSPLKVRGV